MPESITPADVAHVAALARLRLTEDEVALAAEQLGAILDHARDLAALDLDDVDPMVHPVALVNVLRDDEPRPGVDRDEVLAMAPAAEDRRFRVPPVLGEEP